MLTCKLTTPELRERKATILKSLRAKILAAAELEGGYSYEFPGSDGTVRELAEFIVTERACCDFFTFTLAVAGETARLDLTGPAGVKEFILGELEFPAPAK